jgi:hypothetical protein
MNVSLVAGQGLLCEELFVTLVALVFYPQVNLHVEKYSLPKHGILAFYTG